MSALREGRDRGFSLIELMLVILLIGILAGMAYYTYGRMLNKARMSQAQTVLQHLHRTELIYYSEASRFTDNPVIIDYDPVKFDYYRVSVSVDNTGQNFLGVAEGIGPMVGDRWTIDRDGVPAHALDNAYVRY